MVSRPTDVDGNPTDRLIDRIDGINANITINAQVSPNITIRILTGPENSTTETPTINPANNQPSTFSTSSPVETSNRATGLAPEIIAQITNSVQENSSTGRPIVIECENTNTNSEIGRVIGRVRTVEIFKHF